MKRSLTILLVLSMVFGSIFGLMGDVKAQPTVTPTVVPNSVNQIAAYTFTWTQASAYVDEFRLVFPAGFNLTSAVVNSTTCMISPYYTSDVTLSGNTIIFHFPTTNFLSIQSQITITISKDAKIRNPAVCGTLAPPIDVTRELHAPNPVSSTIEAHFVYYVESTVTFAATNGVVVDPPIVDTAAQLTLTATLGGCGALVAGDTINIELPSSYGSYSYTAPDPSCVTVEYGPVLPLGSSFHPATITKENYPLNLFKLELPFGTSIAAGDIVRVTFSRTCNIKTPATANYYTFGFGTSREKFSVQSTRVMIANHLKVTVLGNTVSSRNPEYKLEWTLHSGATLSGDNGDWIEVNFYHATNPAPDNASIINDFTIPAQLPPASSILLTNTYGWSWGGTSYYASSVVALGPKSLRINLPGGFTVSAGGTITITFLASAGLINTATAGTYKLQARHSNAQEWIPSDGYSILDGVIYNATPSVYVSPPTVSQEAGYTVVFSTGQRLRTGDTITIAFPSGTSLKNWNSSLAAGSIYLFSGPQVTAGNPAAAPFPPSNFPGADIIFDPNIDCPPVRNPAFNYPIPLIGPMPLALNATVTSSGSSQVVVLTIPNGFDAPAGNWIAIRFCKSAGLINPSAAGSYTLQIKTSTQPAYAISTSYLITTTASSITVTPNPNGTCSQNVEYKIQFTPGVAGDLRGDAGDFVDISFYDPINPTPDYASIQNVFQTTTPPPVAVTDTYAYVSPPFVNWSSRWDIFFKTGTALVNGTDRIIITFPPTVRVPTTFGANQIYVSNAPFGLLDPPLPAGTVVPPANITVSGQIVTILTPLGFAAGDTVYLRLESTAGIQNPSGANASYTIYLETSTQTNKVPTYFGITDDYNYVPTGNAPSVNPQWRGHDLSIVPTVFPSTTATPAQYDIAVTANTTSGCSITGASTLVLEFPAGTIIPNTIPANAIRVSANPPPFNFAQESAAAGNIVTATADPSRRTITLTGFAGGPYTDMFIRIYSSAGIINPSNPSPTLQINMSLTNSGCVANEGITVPSEYYVITPPRIGGINIPSQSVYVLGGYYYSGFQNNWVSRIDVLPGMGNLKTLRVWIPAGVQLQQGQQSTIVFTSAAGLVNTCTAGSYVLSLRTSKEMTWIKSSPYAIVDSVQFVCGNYPKANPPTVSQTAQYDLSFTVGPMGGLKADIDTISIAFPSMTLFSNGGGYGSGTIPAGSIYVSTSPIVGDTCPPPAPAVACKFNGTISNQTVTITTPIPIGNGQTVYVRFCKSAGVTNPSTAGAYTLQVKTSIQNNYAVSCQYAIGTAINNVEITPLPDATCNQNVEYQVKFQIGSSGGLTGDNSDYVEIDFADPSNVNGTSIQNNFRLSSPSPSSIMFYPGYYTYGYGGKPASQVLVLSEKKLRVYLPSGFSISSGGQVMMVFTSGARLNNTCTPGSFKALVSTSKELAQVSSKPYSIVDAVMFNSGIPVEVVPPVVSLEAQYTITFDVSATGGLTANSGTISIAFPTGTTVPYSISPGTIWVANGQFNTGTTCPPTAPVGVNFSQVVIPPTVSGQVVTFTVPINIPNGGRVSVRFCRAAAIKNPYTAGAYQLQVKTSSQPAYATSYPYPIKTAISNIKVTPNPNTICSEDVEYKIDFTNSASGQLSGDLGDYVEVQFDDSRNPLPDLASIQNNFSATGSVSNVRVNPLARPLAYDLSVWDISFQLSSTGALSVADYIDISFPTTFSLAAPAIGDVLISNNPWSNYYFGNNFDNTNTSWALNPLAVTTFGTTLRIWMPVAVAGSTSLYIRLNNNIVTNYTAGNTYAVQVSTNRDTVPTSSNYYGINSYRWSVAGAVDTNPIAGGPFPPKLYPQNAGSVTQVDIEARLVNALNAVAPNLPRIKVSFPLGFTIPTVISQNSIYLSVGTQFNNCYSSSSDPIPAPPYYQLTSPPVVSGNDVIITIPAVLVPAMVAGAMVDIQIRPSAGIRNPSTPTTNLPLQLDTSWNNAAWGTPVDTEYVSITPAQNPLGTSSILTNQIIFGSIGYYTYGNVYPSRIEVVGTKTLRIYLPLGYTIGASSQSTITFLPSAHLRNTCTAGNYILKMRTSKDQDFMDSLPYAIVAAVRDITVRAVPPIVSTIANYTVVFTDTSTTGMRKDRDTITISFPSETVLPATMSAGSVYVARTADFSNEICPPTHPGSYGVHYAPLNAPPVVSGSTVTLTVPFDINPGELISIRFCASAGIVNPGYARYYTLQVMTSVQPQYALSRPYPIVTGLNKPKVTVTPNIISRATCQTSEMTITFNTGTSGKLTKGTNRIYIAVEMDPNHVVPGTNRGYFMPTSFMQIDANCIMINGTQATANANVYQNPTGDKVPKPLPSFSSIAVIEIIPPVDISSSTEVKVVFKECSGLCNPYLSGNYTLAVWTDVENTANESEVYAILNSVFVVNVDVQPPTVSTQAQYTIEFITYSTLTAGSSTITITFPDDTKLPTYIMPGHIKISDDAAFSNDATPPLDSMSPVTISGQSITFVCPYSFIVSGINPFYHIWVRFSIESGLINPSKEGPYTLKLRTSSQPNDANSSPYYITLAIGGAEVTVTPPTSKYVNARYRIDMTLSSKGDLLKDISSISLLFPDNDIYGFGGGYAAVGSTLPTAISATNIYVNDVICRMNANIDYTNRTITIFMPVDVKAESSLKIEILEAAGMRNPITGSYRLKIKTTKEPIWIESKIYQIYSTLGGPLAGRNPVVAVSYLVATTTMDAVIGATVVNVDQTLGWKNGVYAAVGDLTNWFDAQIVQITGVGAGSLTFTQPLAKDTPNGTPFFYLKTFRSTILAVAAASGATSIQVNDARPFVGEQYLLVGPTDFTAELHRIASIDLTTNTINLDPAFPIVGNPAAGSNVFKFVNNIGVVNEEAYYNISFVTGSTGNLNANASSITITFPSNTSIPASITPQTVKISTDNIIYRSCDTVISDKNSRTLTITTPIDIGPNGAVYISIMPQSGIRNPTYPGTFRLKVRTSTEAVDVESLAYYMEGNGAPSVTVDPCIKGEVGAKYSITFTTTTRLPSGSHVYVTFPQDTVLPSVLRQENVLINGMAIVAPITVTTSTLEVDITTPKEMPASLPITISFLPESRIKNPSSVGYFRMKVRTSVSPNNVDVYSVDYYICPKQTPGDIVIIPGCPLNFVPGQSKTIQAQLKDVNNEDISYGVDYNWNTTIGAISGISGGTMTLTAPSSSGTGTLTVDAVYQGTKKTQTCTINVSAPLGGVSIVPAGPFSFNVGATQVLSAQAKDSDGKDITSGVSYKWSITGTMGSISPSSGQQTTFTASSSPSSGTITCEATYAGTTKSASTNINVVSSGGSGGGGSGGGGSGGGGTQTGTLIRATVDPTSVVVNNTIGAITFTLTALDDLSGGEIRITFPSTWGQPTVDKIQIPASDGVSIGSVMYTNYVISIPINTMQSGKQLLIMWMNPPPAPAPNNYVFTVVAKKAGTAEPSGASPQPLIVASAGSGPVSADGTGLCIVNPDTVSAGATGVKLTFIFTAQADITDGKLQIAIPRDWTQPTQTDNAKGNIRVINSEGDVPTILVLQNGIVEFMFMKFLKNQKLTFEYINVDVPSEEKTDTFTAKTASKTGVLKALTVQPQVKIQKTGITGLSVTPKPSAAGSAAGYDIRFKSSIAGQLTKGAGTIYLQFPVDTLIPSTVNASTIKVQSIEALAVEANQANRSLLITTGTDIPANSTVMIQISDQSGLKNPTMPGSEYKLLAKTSSDGSLVQSAAYSIDASKVSQAKVTPDPVITSAEAQYTITFNTGAGGRLFKATDKIILEFRNDTYIPPQILPTNVTINGKQLTSKVEIDTIALKVILVVPDAIAENAEVKIIFAKDAGIKNPTKSGSYTLYVSTTKETLRVESETYMIGQSSITGLKVTPSSTTAGEKCVDYNIEFTTGQFGQLTPASTITIWMHPSYSIGSMTAQRILINGTSVNSTPSIKQNQGWYITFSPAMSIGPNSNVKITLKCIDNTSSSGTYYIQGSTSAEPTYMKSNDYKIGEILATTAIINPNSPSGDFGWYKEKPSITLTCSQSTATIWYSVDGGTKQRYTGAPVVIEYGQHTFDYWATDPNYNEEQKQSLGTIKVDNVKPKFTVVDPKDGTTVTTGTVKVKCTYEEDYMYEVRVNDFTNPGSTVQKAIINKSDKTFEFTYVLLKGSNSINIVAVDEAGNTSFEPPLTINYNPVSQPTLTITAPQNNSEVTGEVKLIPEATKGMYHIEGSTSIVASIDGDVVKVEVSSDTAPTEWIQLTIDSLLKKVTGTPGLKLKAGVNVLTFRVTDSSGKQYMFTRTVVANVSIRFDNIKSFNTKTGKLPIPTPDKSSYNGVAFKTTDGAYPFITEDGRTVLPFRLMGNAFGMKVSWDGATMTASFEFEGTTLKLKQGSNMATIIKNGVPTTRQIDLTNKNVVPVNVGARLYVPARFITDVFGFPAPYWNGTTRTVMLCYPAACKP